MKLIGIISATLLLLGATSAAETFHDFEGAPQGWTAVGSTAQLSASQYKSGRHSLAWTFRCDGSETPLLSARFEPHIVQADSCFGFWLHNRVPAPVRLYALFYSGEDEVARVWYNLNFEGWRPLLVNFSCLGIADDTAIDRVELTFAGRPAFAAPQTTLYIDAVRTFVVTTRHASDDQQPWAGNAELLRLPEAMTIFKTDDLSYNRPWLPPYVATDKIPVAVRTQIDELAEYYAVELFFEDEITYTSFEEVRNDFAALCIALSPDGEVSGRPIQLQHAATIPLPVPDAADFKKDWLKALKKCVAAYHKESGDRRAEAEQMFVLLCRHLLNQGFQEGNANSGWIGNGYGYRHYPPHVYRMRDVLERHGLLEAMSRSLAWTSRGDAMLAEECRISCDDMHNFLPHLPGAILLSPDPAERYQRLRALKRFADLAILNPLPIGDDGSVHHHGGHHLHYGSYSVPTFMNTLLLPFRDTPFRIGPEAQEKLRRHVRAMSFQNSFGVAAPNLPMRGGVPFAFNARAVALAMAQLDDPFDPEMAGVYLWELNGGETPESVRFRAAGVEPLPPVGHLTLNTAAVAVHRRADWTVSVAGMLKPFRGLEIYGWMEQNNYGRSSRNGSVFLARRDDTGYRHEGWNWNFWPGATTVVRPPEELFAGYDFYGNQSVFAGGATLAGNGVWGMDFTGSDVTFRKSVFCFDNRITVVTTGVLKNEPRPAGSPGGEVVTTLFQQAISDDPARLPELDGAALGDFPFATAIDHTTCGITLRDNLGNGYYVWPGRNTLRVERREQEWTYLFQRHLRDPADNPLINMQRMEWREKPVWANAKYYTPTREKYDLAYLDMGEKPFQRAAVYTALPQISREELATFAAGMAGEAPPVRLLQSDGNAHAVYDAPTRSWGYVVYRSGDSLPQEGPLAAVNVPAFVLIRETGGGYEIAIATSNPDHTGDFVLRLRGIPSEISIPTAYPNSAVVRMPR